MNIGKQKFNKVAVVGLGYVGLPMASLFAIKGLNVAAFDLDADVVRQINCGQSHIRDKVVEDYVKRAHKSGNLSASTCPDHMEGSDAFVICVPTPIDEHKQPDLSFLLAAIEAITPFLRFGSLLVIESTIFPGTCEE